MFVFYAEYLIIFFFLFAAAIKGFPLNEYNQEIAEIINQYQFQYLQGQ